MEQSLAAGGGGGGGAGRWRRHDLAATESGSGENGPGIRGGGADKHDGTTCTGTHGESVSRRMERTTFLCWEDFEAALGEYCESTFQMYKKRSSVSIDYFNKSRQEDAQYSSEYGRFYSVLFICTHGLKDRNRGNGKRPVQHLRGTSCEASLSVTLTRVLNKTTRRWEYCYRVNQAEPIHTHPVNETIWRMYAENRRVKDPVVLSMVQQLVKAKSPFKQIYQYVLKASGKDVIRQDVRNMINEITNEYKADAVEVRVARILNDFRESDAGNTSQLFVDDGGIARCLTLQTSGMRRLFHLFPEILLVDTTHKTNDLKYKLFGFMVHDTFGAGQFVQHAFVDAETKENMLNAVSTFKKNNEEWERVQVIMVDKDLTEIKVLEDEFPRARVLICHFHVLKYFRTVTASAKYGLNHQRQSEVLKAVQDMVYAKDEDTYVEARDSMLSMIRAIPKHEWPAASSRKKKKTSSSKQASRKTKILQVQGQTMKDDDDVHPFEAYFIANWDECKKRWVTCYRSDCPHLGNHTNNRLESGWGKLKPELNMQMPLDESISTVLTLQLLKEKEFSRQMADIGTVVNRSYDSEMLNVLRIASQHAAELIQEQYLHAVKHSTQVDFIEDRPGHYLVSRDSTGEYKYALDTITWTCSCSFSRTRLLPCYHAMYLRRQTLKNQSVIPLNSIHKRWLLRSDASISIDVPRTQLPFVTRINTKQKTITEQEKFSRLSVLQARLTEAVVGRD